MDGKNQVYLAVTREMLPPMKYAVCRQVYAGRVRSLRGRSLAFWIIFLFIVPMLILPAPSAAGEMAKDPARPVAEPAPPLKLSLNDALALFLRQNLDLIMTGFGIDSAR